VFDSVFEFFDAGFMTEIIADLSRVVFTIGPRPTQLSVQGWAMLPYHVSSGASTSLGGQAPSLDADIRLPSRLGDCSHKVCPNARLIRMMMARISRNLNRSVRHETSVLVFTILTSVKLTKVPWYNFQTFRYELLVGNYFCAQNFRGQWSLVKIIVGQWTPFNPCAGAHGYESIPNPACHWHRQMSYCSHKVCPNAWPNVSQGSVATYARCGRKHFTASLPRIFQWKKLQIKIW